MQEIVTYQICSNFAVVTIENPPVNALDAVGWNQLEAVFSILSEKPAVKAIVLTAICKKDLFVGGSDVKGFLSATPETGQRSAVRRNNIRFEIYRCPVPVICALNGSAIGGGLGLSLMCDYRIASSEAKFALGEINFAVLSFTQFVAARVHNGTAKKMVYGGMQIDAEEALRTGLIDEIQPKREVLPRAIKLAEHFAKQPPYALRRAKETMLKAEEFIFSLGGQTFEDECNGRLWGSNEQKEATRAFLEKRKPNFDEL